MSPRGKGRWLLWICGVGAFAALATVGVSWKDMVRRYRLERLRRDSASLLSILNAPDGTGMKQAARNFAREPHGREAVVSLFLDYFETARAETIREREINPAKRLHPSWKGPPGALGDVDKAILGYRGENEVPGQLMVFWGELRWRNASQNGYFVSDDDTTIALALAELLVECRGASLDLPQYPRLKVEVRSLESVLDWAQRQRPPVSFLGSWAPLHSTNPRQSSALLLSRIVQ